MDDLFNLERYYSLLKTRHLGRPCLYLDSVETTIDVCAHEKAGTIVVAKEQTKGKGQRANTWTSPKGCAMATLKFACGKSTLLSKRLSFLQHILALATAKALENMDSDKLGSAAIRLKWPNDIMFVDRLSGSTQKIGGILVHSQDDGEAYDVLMSFGLNVFNRYPTTCVSGILGTTQGLSIDSIIADVLNNLEHYTDHFTETSFCELKDAYIQRCLQIDKLIEDEEHGRVKVKGVNDDGYLFGEKYEDSRLCIVTRIISQVGS